jgi:restriction endonuclease S subunit
MKKRLKDIADIRTGYQFRGKVAVHDDANVAVIQIKDIDDRFIVKTKDLVPVKVDKPEPYLVSQGDVLFLSRGHRQYAAVIHEPVQNTIATGYFFILSPRTKLVRPDFLAWAINQPDFQEALRPFVRGSHIPLISKTDFQDQAIVLPPLPVQEKVIELHHLFDHERELTAALEHKRGELVQAISRKLLTGQLRIKESDHE